MNWTGAISFVNAFRSWCALAGRSGRPTECPKATLNIRISVYAIGGIDWIVARVKMTLATRLGLCVRRLRQESGMSQVVFGERCGFYQTYLSRLERGQANPTLNALEVIAGGLGLTVFQLFEQVQRTDTKGQRMLVRGRT
jgi:DNA-binding XRE family transcriptional regulator